MQNERIKADDEFILHSSDGKDYKIIIYDVNPFRPPEFAIAFFLYDENGKLIPSSDSDNVWFVGEGFFILNKGKIEKCEIKK